ncbi:hypothetical protein Lal_00048995 [Lupinus albus]|nr:hypothetical protein Lal_00048995 [Lupinus albus]
MEAMAREKMTTSRVFFNGESSSEKPQWRFCREEVLSGDGGNGGWSSGVFVPAKHKDEHSWLLFLADEEATNVDSISIKLQRMSQTHHLYGRGIHQYATIPTSYR